MLFDEIFCVWLNSIPSFKVIVKRLTLDVLGINHWSISLGSHVEKWSWSVSDSWSFSCFSWLSTSMLTSFRVVKCQLFILESFFHIWIRRKVALETLLVLVGRRKLSNHTSCSAWSLNAKITWHICDSTQLLILLHLLPEISLFCLFSLNSLLKGKLLYNFANVSQFPYLNKI